MTAGKPIITCVDDESEFAKLVRKYGIENAGTSRPEKLEKLIFDTRMGNCRCENALLWDDFFTKGKSITAHCDALKN